MLPLQVLVVGNGGVGKTSMIRRFCKGMFTDEYKKTIGVDFLEKSLYVEALGQEVRFMLWDTGNTLRVHACMIVPQSGVTLLWCSWAR